MTRPSHDLSAWQVRAAAPDDWRTLRGLDGCELPPPGPGETAWVAVLPGVDRAAAPAATLRLRRRIGRPVPRAWFRMGWAVHASAELDLYRQQRTLLLCHDLTGADELTDWGLSAALAPAAAGPAWAALLHVAMAALAEAASGDAPLPCIAELPGLRNAEGHSPVWQGLGRHFHGQDLDAARRQHGPGWSHHVASLLPRHLLYASLLPAATQDALGQVPAQAQPLRQALLHGDFEPREHIGITDGGPVLERWPRPSA